MKIGIISDIHDNIVNLDKFLDFAKNHSLAEIICLGDVTNEDTVRHLAHGFNGKINLIRGNMDLYEEDILQEIDNINYLGRYGSFVIEGKKIGLIHEPDFYNELLKDQKDFAYIFYGHTHKPWVEKKNGVIMANPGTLGGVFQKACFAVWDTESGSLELKILELL